MSYSHDFIFISVPFLIHATCIFCDGSGVKVEIKALSSGWKVSLTLLSFCQREMQGSLTCNKSYFLSI